MKEVKVVSEETNNKLILEAIKNRLKLGNVKFGHDMPKDGEMNRDNMNEAYEEVIDLVIYVAGVIISDITMKDRYKKGYEILHQYYDSIPDEEKPIVNKQLDEIGLWKHINKG